jgi:TolB-like protein
MRDDTRRKLAAIMFTDLVGFSALMSQGEDHALDVLDEHNRLIEKAIQRRNGKLLKRLGDGIFAEFNSASDAVECAIEIQEQLRTYNAAQSMENQIWVRIGLHVGDVVVRGNDLFGDGINVAARLEPLAEPGGICISEAVFQLIKSHMDIEIFSPSEAHLKNIPGTQIVYFNPARPDVDNTFQTTQNKIQAGITRNIVAAQSIAVLPFTDMSPEKDQEYLSDGIAEELLNLLARVPELFVAARTSAFSYKNKEVGVEQISRQLNVAHVLEGSVRKAGDRIRITAQLIRAENGFHLWSGSWDRTLVDVFALQDEIATIVVEQLKHTLLTKPELTTSKATRYPADPVAYEAYLKGRFHWYRFDEQDLDLSIRYFRQSLTADPEYVMAYVGLADALATRAHLGLVRSKTAYPKAKKLLQRALQLDSDLAEAYDLTARIQFAYDWDWDAAESSFRRSIDLNPALPDAHAVYSQLLGLQGRWLESMQEIELASLLDPLNPWYQLERAERLAWSGDVEEGLAKVRLIAEANQGWGLVSRSLWGLAYATGDHELALDSLRSYYRLIGEEAAAELLDVNLVNHSYPSIMECLGSRLAGISSRPYVDPIELAEIYAHANNEEKMFGFLQQALDQRESRLVYVFVDPVFAGHQTDSRLLAIRTAMDLDNSYGES